MTDFEDVEREIQDIVDIPAVEVIVDTFVRLLTTAAVHCGLGDQARDRIDLDEARKLINAAAGLVTAAAPDLSDHHARPLREALRQVQLAFREASPVPDPPGMGPGEKYTGPVN